LAFFANILELLPLFLLFIISFLQLLITSNYHLLSCLHLFDILLLISLSQLLLSLINYFKVALDQIEVGLTTTPTPKVRVKFTLGLKGLTLETLFLDEVLVELGISFFLRDLR
jgi:hypothetical protein